MNIFKQFALIGLIGIFLYIGFFSIQNFWQGIHNLDLSFNFIRLGYTQDINVNGKIMYLSEFYLIGLNQIRNSFIWMCINCIFGSIIGYLNLLLIKGGEDGNRS